MELNKYIDHTLLKPTATLEEISVLCKEAISHDFYAVCVNSYFIPHARRELQDSEIKLAAVVGFPLGAMATEAKVSEAQYCIEQGADEIDVVMNLGLFKSGYLKEAREELRILKNSIGSAVLKVIIESCYLSEEEVETASRLVMESGADFVKTSTGFGSRGATIEDVELMKRTVGDRIKIKASGGIRDRETALKYVERGASRLGTSSGVKIVQ